MPTPNKTPAQRLQECLDDKAQLQNLLDRNEGLMEELENTRDELAQLQAEMQKDSSLSTAERRRFEELIREANEARDTYTRRAVRAETRLGQQQAVFNELHALLDGKECILPQIRALLARL